jgi:hypothetical protein
MSSYAVSGVPVIHSGSPSSGPSALELASSRGDELDPELIALPAPPRRERTLTLAILLLATLSALALTFALRGDLAYALSPGSPLYVGDLRTATEATLAAGENRLVRAEAMLGVAGGIRYERAFVSDTFRTLPVAGRAGAWVDLRVPAGQESGRWEPPRELVGRLVRMGRAGPRHRGLADAIARAGQVWRGPSPAGYEGREGISESAWLLVDGEDPASARWSLALAAALLAFGVWNAVAFVRIVRRVA